VSSNFLEGPLPGCLLDSPVEELDVAGNELAGPLPEGPYDRSVLAALSAGGQRRPNGGLTGPLPPGLLALSTLRVLDLSDGALSGTLQLLPPNAGVFNVSGNQLGSELPALPQTLWAGDFSANQFTGAIPLLSGLPALEALAVRSNALVGPVPTLPPGITYLDASYNQLQGGARWVAPAPSLLHSTALGQLVLARQRPSHERQRRPSAAASNAGSQPDPLKRRRHAADAAPQPCVAQRWRQPHQR
jgi:hypothetical protein